MSLLRRARFRCIAAHGEHPLSLIHILLAMQIRIADFIARAPDQLEKTNGTECAHIKDGSIVIEPVGRQEVS